MKLRVQRGTMLIEVISLLPLIMGAMAVGYQVSAWLMRTQSVESRLLSDESVGRDMIRRVQSDAGRATQAVVRRDEDAVTLELRRGDALIVYRFAGAVVERTERSADTVTSRYAWRLELSAADVRHEVIGSSPGVVWVVVTSQLPMGAGPDLDYRLAAAAAVGRDAARAGRAAGAWIGAASGRGAESSTGSSRKVYSRTRLPPAQSSSTSRSTKGSLIGRSLLSRTTGRAARVSTLTRIALTAVP